MNDSERRPGGRRMHRLAENPVASMVEEARNRLDEWERAIRKHEQTVRNVAAKGWTIDDVLPDTDQRGCSVVTAVAAMSTEEATVRYDLIISPDEWTHYVDGPGVHDPLSRRTPTGVVMSPEKARELVREARVQEREGRRREAEWLLYLDMRAERAPGERPPSEEEVRDELERRRALPETQEDESQDGYFVVEYDAPDAKGEGAA